MWLMADQTSSNMFTSLPPPSSSSHAVCCRCNCAATDDTQALLAVPFCTAHHYMCRSCLRLYGALSYCPGCVVVPTTTRPDPWLSRTSNGASSHADTNGNGPPSTSCSVCHSVAEQVFFCQTCGDVSPRSSLCQSCWQQHQLELHIFPSLQLTASSSNSTRGTCSPRLQDVLMSSSQLPSRVSVLRHIRPPGLSMSNSDQAQSLSSLLSSGTSLLGGLASSETSLVVSSSGTASPGGRLLVAANLQDHSVRQRRLLTLASPLSRQYEGWLWQALNNGGFEQAVHNIDERKQQIGVSLQSTLRDMEFRLERARGILDELYRDYMRQVIEVSRCQMEALQVQSEMLQRVRAAAARLQHARLYNDKTRAVLAEADLATALRHNAASTCLRPCDDGWIEFRSPNDDELRAFLRSACVVDSRVHPSHCSVQSVEREVNCLSWTTLGRLSEFDIQLRSHAHAGVDDPALTVLITDSRGVEVSYEYQRRSAGHYVVRYRAQSTGTHHIYVLLRDRHLADSPYTVGVTQPLCYRLTDSPSVWSLRPIVSLSYNLVKPWGVCCLSVNDSQHQLLVADRDAHSVFVFDTNGSFITRHTSSFRRPTHLAVTSQGHVVVTDKDNHRIQIFTSSWTHVRTFGSEGDRDGQFRYPWEVAVNSSDDILVSDSKNYRVQLFTFAGLFITKHCLERASREDKDGPRGVAFAPNDFAAVADFDMLRVLVLSPDLRSVVHVIGVPGLCSTPRSFVELRTKGCIERPRGLAFDAAGNLIVVQARTNRETNSLIKFTVGGECYQYQVDKDACGVCICHDGRIAVVQPQTGVVVYTNL